MFQNHVKLRTSSSSQWGSPKPTHWVVAVGPRPQKEPAQMARSPHTWSERVTRGKVHEVFPGLVVLPPSLVPHQQSVAARPPPSLSLAGSGPSIWRSDGREPLVAYYYYYNWLMGGQAERSDPGPPLLVCVAGQWGRATWQAVEDLLWYHEFFGCELVHACAVLKSPSLFLISFRPLRKVPLCLSYSPTSLIRHSITRQPRYNVTNSVNQTFLLESTSMIRPWHCWLDTPWPPNCCIVEVLYAYMALGLGKVG